MALQDGVQGMSGVSKELGDLLRYLPIDHGVISCLHDLLRHGVELSPRRKLKTERG